MRPSYDKTSNPNPNSPGSVALSLLLSSPLSCRPNSLVLVNKSQFPNPDPAQFPNPDPAPAAAPTPNPKRLGAFDLVVPTLGHTQAIRSNSPKIEILLTLTLIRDKTPHPVLVIAVVSECQRDTMSVSTKYR